jgi:hypothetical protein
MAYMYLNVARMILFAIFICNNLGGIFEQMFAILHMNFMMLAYLFLEINKI